MNIYSIKDNKIGFSTVFTAPNNAAAIRMFGDTCADPKTMFGAHPEDFDLYVLGEMNEDTGELKSEVKFLERALTFAKVEKKE